MRRTHSDGLGGAPASEIEARCGGVSAGGGSVAELAVLVVSPTLDVAIVQKHTSVAAIRNDRFGRESASKVHRGRGWRSSRHGVAVAEVAFVVESPTLDAVVVQDRAGALHAHRHGLGSAPCPKIDHGRWRGL